MTRTVVALYEHLKTAKDVVNELVNQGFDRDKISLVASDAKGEYQQHLDRNAGDDIMADTGKGAGIGAVLGGLAGLVVGLGALAIPGIGPIVAAGPLASALAGAGIGAAAGGLVGALTNIGVPEEQAEQYAEGVKRGGTLVTLQAPDKRIDQAIQIMNSYDPIDVSQRSQEWRSGQPMASKPMDRDRMRTQEDQTTMPVVEEELQVGKREVDKGDVRVHKTVSERPVEEDVSLREEHVDVERRPVNRPASKADMDAFKEETYEFTEKAEEPVVRKEARVVEEVDIHKDFEEHQEKVGGTVRRTDVEVERMGAHDFDEFEPMLRNHFQTTYSHRGSSYDDYAPAYRYGYDMANNNRYEGRRWKDIERDAQQDWERRHPNNAWEEFKAAIRQGWEVATRQR